MDSATSGPSWLVVTLAGISLLGIVVTAVVGPAVVEWVKRGRPTGAPPAPAVFAQQSADAIDLIRDALRDLQERVGQLERLQMRLGAGRHR